MIGVDALEQFTGHEVVDWWIPGPVPDRRQALEAAAAPSFGHRTELMQHLMDSLEGNLLDLVNADPDTHRMIIASGSGTDALEMAARSFTHPNLPERCRHAVPRVLTTSIGLFGDLWDDVFRANAKKTEAYKVEDGGQLELAEIHDALSDDIFEIMTATHNDTSVGAVNDLESLGALAREYDVMFFVDAVSSAGGLPIDVDRDDIDFLAMAPQKCLGSVPGLKIAVVSDRALQEHLDKYVGYGTSVMSHVKSTEQGTTLTTPAEGAMLSLAVQLDYIMHDEGAENRYARHAFMGEMVRDWADAEGFPLLPDEENASDTVSCLVNERGLPLDQIQTQLLQQNIGFDAGHGKLNPGRLKKGLPDTFRIPTMGDRPIEQLEEYLAILSETFAQYE